MSTLIEQLKAELQIEGEEALRILKTIVEYIENQHPLLKDIADDMLEKELQQKNTCS